MDLLNISIEEWMQNEEQHQQRLEDPKLWDKIPLINVNAVHLFKDETLVRFRGMIQDMQEAEYYIPQYNILNRTTNETTIKWVKYRDVAQCSRDEEVNAIGGNKLEERHPYVVVSIPGLNPWVHNCERQKYKVHLNNTDLVQSTSSLHQKRSYDEIMETDIVKTDEKSVKKVNSEETVEQKSKPTLLSQDYILNHPLPDSNSSACHLIIYKDVEKLSLNKSYEFVGFLSLNTFEYDDDDDENCMKQQVRNPPTSLIPRIHVVHLKKITHANPLVDNVLFEGAASFSSIKKELTIALTQLLLGDSLAAEYLICQLVSSVYVTAYMSLGQFCLNISNIPKFENIDYGKQLYEFLELFVTKSHYLPLTLDNMNSLCFTPKKDFTVNRLNTGLLQLSENTLFLIDETKLEEGKLDSSGVSSVQAINHTILCQKVKYDFNYVLEYDCDIQFLILSEGKSMLHSNVHMKLQPEKNCLDTFEAIVQAAKHFFKPELLNQIRVYLTKARLQTYEITDSAYECIQQQFADMRQTSNITADDLHSLLVLSRLLWLSEGSSVSHEDCFKKACEMEMQRKARIQN